jgi:hypothetical protein
MLIVSNIGTHRRFQIGLRIWTPGLASTTDGHAFRDRAEQNVYGLPEKPE